MPAAATKPSTKATVKENERKWGKPLLAAGFSMVPVVLFTQQKQLGLSANDINVLMQLVAHWWYAERLPYPSIAEIARRMGVHRSTIQRCVRSLEERGLVRREVRTSPSRGQLSNAYDLTGLISTATPLAKKQLEERDRNKRKGKLRVIAEEDGE